MIIAIIKYNAGNIMSVDYALQRLGVEAIVTDDPVQIMAADKVIFPGVGEASTTMKYLKERKLDRLILELKQPVLGICLGLQLMCCHSEEGDTTCIGIFSEHVKKFLPPADCENKMKVPHMGWNTITNLKTTLFDRIAERQYAYFVHSFYAETGKDTIAECNYILPFSAALNNRNFYASQFHPEKSGRTGSQIIENFIAL